MPIALDQSTLAILVGAGGVVIAQVFTTYQSRHRDKIQQRGNDNQEQQSQRAELNTNIWNLVHALQEDVKRQRDERNEDIVEFNKRIDDLETQLDGLTKTRGTLNKLIRDLLEVVRSKHVELSPRILKDVEEYQRENH